MQWAAACVWRERLRIRGPMERTIAPPKGSAYWIEKYIVNPMDEVP